MKIKFLVLFVLLVFATTAQALTIITTADGNGADTYITNNAAGKQTSTQNWSTEVRIRAFRQQANSRFLAGFLKFDLTGAQAEIAGDISHSKLMLDATFLKGAAKFVSVYGLPDGDGEKWVESTITYATAPGFRVPQIGDNGATVAGNDLGNYAFDSNVGSTPIYLGTLMTPPIPSPVTYPFRFTSWSGDLPLSNFIKADTNGEVTFLFIGGNNEIEIASKEHLTALAPTLILVPEPATIAMLGLGCLSLLRRKR